LSKRPQGDGTRTARASDAVQATPHIGDHHQLPPFEADRTTRLLADHSLAVARTGMIIPAEVAASRPDVDVAIIYSNPSGPVTEGRGAEGVNPPAPPGKRRGGEENGSILQSAKFPLLSLAKTGDDHNTLPHQPMKRPKMRAVPEIEACRPQQSRRRVPKRARPTCVILANARIQDVTTASGSTTSSLPPGSPARAAARWPRRWMPAYAEETAFARMTQVIAYRSMPVRDVEAESRL
jgi:hypothetical protein